MSGADDQTLDIYTCLHLYLIHMLNKERGQPSHYHLESWIIKYNLPPGPRNWWKQQLFLWIMYSSFSISMYSLHQPETLHLHKTQNYRSTRKWASCLDVCTQDRVRSKYIQGDVFEDDKKCSLRKLNQLLASNVKINIFFRIFFRMVPNEPVLLHYLV